MSEVDLGSKFLKGTKQAGVLRLVIDRAERRNALTMEMYRGIKRAAVIADADPEIDALVITGVEEPLFQFQVQWCKSRRYAQGQLGGQPGWHG